VSADVDGQRSVSTREPSVEDTCLPNLVTQLRTTENPPHILSPAAVGCVPGRPRPGPLGDARTGLTGDTARL
jgi:hypothetical protein